MRRSSCAKGEFTLGGEVDLSCEGLLLQSAARNSFVSKEFLSGNSENSKCKQPLIV